MKLLCSKCANYNAPECDEPKYLHTRAIPSHITLPRVQYVYSIYVSVAIVSHAQGRNYIFCREVVHSLKMECKCYLHVGLRKEENRVQTLAEIMERALRVLHSHQFTQLSLRPSSVDS